MVERYRPATTGELPPPAVPENMFLERREITFLSSGCVLLDCIIGGGWPFSRMVNIIGDKSTGKTLLAEEAMLLFHRKHKRKPHYRETESAFDVSYFESLGGTEDMIDFGPKGPDTHWRTIEQIIDDMTALLDKVDANVRLKAKALKELKVNKKKRLEELDEVVRKQLPMELYIVDSLDSTSSEAELKRDIHEGSYNLEKQKLFGEFCRKEIGRIKRANICFMIISQTRDRIGPMIRGAKYRRHCDSVLNFYCSAVVYLADCGKVYETNKGIKRPVAIKIRAKCDKNKISMPFRQCTFELRFGYGIDDDWACLDFLKEVGRLKDMGLKELPKTLKGLDLVKLKVVTKKVWWDIETMFIPPKGKYAEPETTGGAA
jgi:recombination protein RecA